MPTLNGPASHCASVKPSRGLDHSLLTCLRGSSGSRTTSITASFFEPKLVRSRVPLILGHSARAETLQRGRCPATAASPLVIFCASMMVSDCVALLLPKRLELVTASRAPPFSTATPTGASPTGTRPISAPAGSASSFLVSNGNRSTDHSPYGYAVSQRNRKLVEQAFGWMNTVGGMRKLRHRGRPSAGWFTFSAAAHNIVRLRRLLPATT